MPGSVAYLVRSWPRLTQTFVLDEVLNLQRLGVDVRLFALARGDESIVQPEVAAVVAPVRFLGDEAAAAAHVRVVRRAPVRYLRAAWTTVRNRRWNEGYRSASPRRCFSFAVQLADMLRQDSQWCGLRDAPARALRPRPRPGRPAHQHPDRAPVELHGPRPRPLPGAEGSHRRARSSGRGRCGVLRRRR